MKKAYIKIYNLKGDIIAKRVIKGYDSKKSFKRYSLPYCLNGLNNSNRSEWNKIEFFTYKETSDLINENFKKIGVIYRDKKKCKKER